MPSWSCPNRPWTNTGGRIYPENTIVIADATLINKPPPGLTNYFPVEATWIAEDKLGKVLFADIVMLGALAAVTRFVSLEALENSLKGNVPPKTIEQNRTALKKGYQVGRCLKSTSEMHD